MNKFIVVTTVYNAVNFIEKCLNSILNQTYRNFELVVVDDCSTDGTSNIIVDIWDNNFKYFRNNIRIGSVICNTVKCISLCPGEEDDIIVIVDGDDWLYSDNVFDYLDGVYKNPEIWLTYGQFTSVSGKLENFCKPLINTRNYRKHGTWITSHIRTFKRKLWNKINNQDLRDKKGEYYTSFEDTTYMFPMIEMAGLKHIKFIDKILYVYNDKNPLCTINDSKKAERMKNIYPIISEIKRKPCYNEIS